jgi:RNA polymerase-binding transcription factor DksA
LESFALDEEFCMTKIEERRTATSADILGRGPDTPRINPRWQKYFESLNHLREYIAQERSTQMEKGQTGEPVFGVNPADRGTDEYDIGAALSLISSEQNALYEIDQAIQRMRDGTYGICEATGKPIPPERLEAVPWTRFARNVEADLEREQETRKPRHVL